MKSISGFLSLIKFILRRDKLYLPIWIVGLASLVTFFVPLMPGFFGDEQSSAVLVEMMKNPAMIALMGVSYGSSMGALFAAFMIVWCALSMGIFNILFVIRHTRKDEEQGRSEIIASLAVGRSANLLAVLATACAANLIIALICMVTIPAFGVDGVGLEGAIPFSLALGACGFVFACFTALLAQLFESSKATSIWAFLILGLAYMLRAYGDMEPDYEILSLVSPLGLVQRTQAWVQNEYWPVAVLLIAALCLSAMAFGFSSIRDTGAGMIPQRSGRAHASAFLRGEWSFAWRLTSGMFIGWTIVMLVLGASYGAIVPDIEEFMGSNELYKMILSGADADVDMMASFTSFLMMCMAVLSAVPVCMVIFKLKTEESQGRLELVLAKRVSRMRLMAGFLIIAVLLAVVLLIATPLGMYSATVYLMDSPPALDTLMLSSLNYLPVLLAVAAFAALLVGVAPKLSSTIWVYLTYCFLMAYMGNVLLGSAADEDAINLANAVIDTSIFSAVPMWPTEEVNLVLTCAILAAAAVLVVVALLTYRRRDIK